MTADITSNPSNPAPASRRRRISWRKRLTFLVLGLFLLAGFIELACYIGKILATPMTLAAIRAERDSDEVFDVDDETQPSEVAHPYLGWTRNPQSRKPELFEGRAYHPNDFGLMDEASPLRKRRSGKVIVAVAGGSVAWQVAAAGNGALLRELRRQPRFQGKEIELVRLAVGGYKQPQQLMLLTYLLSLGAEFDLLVNIDGYNETALHPAENANGGIFPPYPRAWKLRLLERTNPADVLHLASFLSNKASRRAWRQWFSRIPFQASATVNFTWWTINNRFSKNELRAQLAILQGRLDKPGYHVVGPRQEFENDEEMYAYLVNYWAQCSRQMDRLCQANGIEYHHVLPPNQYLAGSKLVMSAAEKQIALLESQFSGAAIATYPMLVQKGKVLRNEGLSFHDLSMLFLEIEEPVYVDNCCHYNRTGNERLATAVAEILGKR